LSIDHLSPTISDRPTKLPAAPERVPLCIDLCSAAGSFGDWFVSPAPVSFSRLMQVRLVDRACPAEIDDDGRSPVDGGPELSNHLGRERPRLIGFRQQVEQSIAGRDHDHPTVNVGCKEFAFHESSPLCRTNEPSCRPSTVRVLLGSELCGAAGQYRFGQYRPVAATISNPCRCAGHRRRLHVTPAKKPKPFAPTVRDVKEIVPQKFVRTINRSGPTLAVQQRPYEIRGTVGRLVLETKRLSLRE
jgi:hypothetical protein